jgi:hypothetical protein
VKLITAINSFFVQEPLALMIINLFYLSLKLEKNTVDCVAHRDHSMDIEIGWLRPAFTKFS